MRLLLTSSGIRNPSLDSALVELLGKPIAESSALFIPTGIYPFPGGGVMARRALCGEQGGPLCGLGWKSLGVLELTALPSIGDDAWIPTLKQTDALLVGGGDPLYLAHWMRESGLANLMPSLPRELVYVGVSGGSMVASASFSETYRAPRTCSGEALTSQDVVFATPQGGVGRTLVTARGVGLVEFALIPHLDGDNHPDASLANAETWAARNTVPTYAIDDQTALKVTDGAVQVVSEGHWKLFQPRR
jgi:dipeptidase E